MEEEVQKWDYENKCMTGTGRFIYDSKGANKALELIGKHLGMYKTDINFNGTLGVKIIDDIKEDDQLTIDVEKIE
jgi:phage terminase small subunit